MYRRLENKKVLITGGAGFIGSNLCDSFVDGGNEVICFDNLSTGFESNISHLMDLGNFRFIKGDIRDLDACMAAMEGVDVLLHQAALGSVPRSINDPLTTNDVNINGFLNILQAARERKVKRVVYAASSSTYGDSKELPKVEDRIGRPLSPYAVTKLVNELYAKVYGDLYGLEIIGLRYFNVFGKRQTPNGAYAAAIPKFIGAFMNHEPPTVHGDGRQSRDFTYIENVIQMNHLAATTEREESLNQVYNTAFGQRTELIELIEAIRKALIPLDEKVADIELVYTDQRAGDVRDSLADMSKAEALLGYKPTHDLNAGIEAAIQWYWQNLK